jgi:hypothetical protein
MTHQRCPGRTETIHRYLDQDLSLAEEEALLAHLQGCSACQETLVTLQGLFTDLASWEEIEPPFNLAPQIMAQLPAPRQQRKLVGQLLLGGQMLVGLVLLIFGFPLLNNFLGRYLSFFPRETLLWMVYFLAGWGIELGQMLNDWWLYLWLPLRESWALTISPSNALLIVACLGLIWLAGNFLLLGQPFQSLKNRGAS